jgi:hypothetical protein
MPLLWALHDITAGTGLLDKPVVRKGRMMKILKELLFFLHSLLDVVAYRITFH